jgi:hypothetical protein
MRPVVLVVVAALATAWQTDASPPNAELPREYVTIPTAPTSGSVISVTRGESFQAALDAAKPGDEITLEPGATFTGPFRLPVKAGTDWITIRSAAREGSLPPAGSRVGPANAGSMPKLVATSGSVIMTAAGAHHYRFIGIEMSPQAGTFLYNLVDLGTGVRAPEDVPHHIVFERCYLHGDPARGTRRGIALNSSHTAIIDSYLADFKEVGFDSQAIAGWTGPGPFKIVNNYLEGAGENVMFGGADPAIRGLVPSDIEVRRNHVSKPLTWKRDEQAFAGTAWTVKNLFELKNARRVLIDGNVFEHSWPHGQTGYAILFTVRNQNGTAPWSVVRDVTFTNNVVRRAANGINILARDGEHPSEPSEAIVIRNNLFYEIGGGRWGRAEGNLFQLLRGTAGLIIDHNTALAGRSVMIAEGEPHRGFVFTNNIMTFGPYGFVGTGTGSGGTLTRYFPGARFAANVFIGRAALDNERSFPSGNFFVGALDDVRFLKGPADTYRLSPASRFRTRGTDGRDLGVDVDALDAAVEGVMAMTGARRADGDSGLPRQ